MRESTASGLQRWKQLELLQEHYASFIPFLKDAMELLGFSASDIQKDIASFLEYGPRRIMVQAQRSQAKTTITAIFAVYCLMHRPNLRVLIVSAGEKTSSQISKLITQIIMTWDILECMRPDRTAGDRTSSEAFDVHHSLKGIDKSPSVACVGVLGSYTGHRADLLIADDIEDPKNSDTAPMRTKLLERTKEFADLCKERIIYLGTPQNSESIYNTLPGRGYSLRIWPGRYPTNKELPTYGEFLAPIILDRIAANPDLQTGGGLDGTRGQPVDPMIVSEKDLTDKEADHGEARFKLQYMLDTSLSDKERYPLKTTSLIHMDTDPEKLPMSLIRDPRESQFKSITINSDAYRLSLASALPEQVSDYRPAQIRVMYIDPAAGGVTSQDETGYSVMAFLNGNLFLEEVGGIPGGYDKEKMEELAEIAKRHKVNKVIIEKNLGYGAFREIFSPIITRVHRCEILDDFVRGQKEKRIVEVLAPIMGRGSLVVTSNAVESDHVTSSRYLPNDRKLYSFFFQLSKLTLQRNSLEHDDRLDAVAGAAHHFAELMAIDQKKVLEKQASKELQQRMNDPFGRKEFAKAQQGLFRKPHQYHNLIRRK